MIIGDLHIAKMVKRGFITNSDIRFVNPASINLRLGNTFLRPNVNQKVVLGEEMKYERYECPVDGGTILPPGVFVLATTMECINVPIQLAAFVQGRSSIGRIGLTVQNAGYVDPGFHGHITLELKNDSPCPILLKPGYPVAQLVFVDTIDVSQGYNGKYNGQVEATGSRMYLDEVEI